MPHVTRNINPEQAQDLLERVPRACISFAGENGPVAQPVKLLWQNCRYLIGISENARQRPSPDQEVVLLVDEGVHYFDLRAIYVRGQVLAVQAPDGAADGQTWIELVPQKTVAWDYGTLREVSDDH